MSDRLIGAKEIADYLKCSRTSLWRYQKKGLPVKGKLGRIEASKKELDAWFIG